MIVKASTFYNTILTACPIMCNGNIHLLKTACISHQTRIGVSYII